MVSGYNFLDASLEPDITTFSQYPYKEPEPKASANVNTLHYNGSIVCHPDTTSNYEKKVDNYKKCGMCHRGFIKHTCNCLISFHSKIQSETGNPRFIDFSKPCHLDKHTEYKKDCPAYHKSMADGAKEKIFTINNRVYNEIADRTAWMYNNGFHRLMFAVLTTPPPKRKYNETELNKAFSRFVENLKTNYGLKHYIAVREIGETGKLYHYHIVLDIPFIEFSRLNRAWCAAIRNLAHFSKNAFRTKAESRFIYNVAGAVRYISKYVSKTKGQTSKTRIFFCDRETAQALIKTPIDIKDPISELRKDYKTLKGYQYNDFVCRFSFVSELEQARFFKEIVTVMFDTPFKKNQLCYKPKRN